MTKPSLYPTYTIICTLSSSEFQTQIQPQRPGRFSNASQKKADIEYPFEHGEVINSTLEGVSIHPVTTKTQASFLIKLPERKENSQRFQHQANGNFETF